jgi:hypothetical protein
VVVLAGYVLLVESDEKLRRNVIRAVAFVLAMMVLRTLLLTLDDALGTINSLVHIFSRNAAVIELPTYLDSFLGYVITIIEKVGLLIFALKATKGDDVKVPVIESVLKKGF